MDRQKLMRSRCIFLKMNTRESGPRVTLFSKVRQCVPSHKARKHVYRIVKKKKGGEEHASLTRTSAYYLIARVWFLFIVYTPIRLIFIGRWEIETRYFAARYRSVLVEPGFDMNSPDVVQPSRAER